MAPDVRVIMRGYNADTLPYLHGYITQNSWHNCHACLLAAEV